jgi:hypothetical protein
MQLGKVVLMRSKINEKDNYLFFPNDPLLHIFHYGAV